MCKHLNILNMEKIEYNKIYALRYKQNRLLKNDTSFNNVSLKPIYFKENIDILSKKILDFIKSSNQNT